MNAMYPIDIYSLCVRDYFIPFPLIHVIIMLKEELLHASNN